jgi:hypothetical protein
MMSTFDQILSQKISHEDLPEAKIDDDDLEDELDDLKNYSLCSSFTESMGDFYHLPD